MLIQLIDCANCINISTQLIDPKLYRIKDSISNNLSELFDSQILTQLIGQLIDQSSFFGYWPTLVQTVKRTLDSCILSIQLQTVVDMFVLVCSVRMLLSE